MLNRDGNFRRRLSFRRREAWLFLGMVILLIVACTNEVDDGNPLGPSSFGVLISPFNPQINKGGTQQFTGVGGITPYTWAVSPANIGDIDAVSGLFTALQIAGTATVNVVDSVGDAGSTTITVLPNQLVIAPTNVTALVQGTQAFTATLPAGSTTVASTITQVSGPDLGLPALTDAAAVTTADFNTTANFTFPVSGTTAVFQITIRDTLAGDVGAVTLTLSPP